MKVGKMPKARDWRLGDFVAFAKQTVDSYSLDIRPEIES
jgi:hypothetical protein